MGPHHRNLRKEPTRVLLRHADAGLRREWVGADERRELTDLGHAQAYEVSVRLRTLAIERILSSPALRCRQTVQPLAQRLSLDVEPCRLLAVDADPVELARFLRHADSEQTL